MEMLLRWWRSRPPIVQDGCLAVVLAVLALTVLRGSGPLGLLGVVASLAIAFRRSAPNVVLVVTGSCFLAATAVPHGGWGTLPPSLVAVGTVTGSSLSVGAGAAVVQAAWACAWLPAHFHDAVAPRAVAVVALFALAVAVALLSGQRRAVEEAAREHARRLRLGEELDASRRAADERLRLARGLHDALGHHVAVANVQAAVAAELMATHPEHARAALAQVQEATTTVLDTLGTVAARLDPPEAPRELETDPGLDAVGALVDAQRAAGLRLDATRVGDPRAVPPAVDLGAYRVVEESLVNARRHGDGAARLTVVYAQDAVVVETVNDLRPPDEPGPGNAPSASEPAGPVAVEPDPRGAGTGIVGMRERVTALGGRLDVGAVSGRFVVRATFPAPGSAPGAAEPEQVADPEQAPEPESGSEPAPEPGPELGQDVQQAPSRVATD